MVLQQVNEDKFTDLFVLCGEATCLTFAAKLATGKAAVEDCKPLCFGYEEGRKKLIKLLE